MTPDFALLLSEDGIILLHRESGAGGWVKADEISLDIPDLTSGMSQLSDTARKLSGGAFTTKLLLPQSQLLYAKITVSDNADADIRAALEDRTPYTAGQLIYDASGSDDTRQIIAVARETLAEATGFISQFGFNPTGFSTIPPEGTFEGEPNLGDFGTTPFVPDTTAVKVIGASKTPEKPETAPKVKAAPKPKAAKPKSPSKTAPKVTPKPEPETKTEPAKEPAAFSSRRHGDDADANLTAERLTKRAPRIVIPDKNVKSPAPKVQIPLRDKDPSPTIVKAPTTNQPVPPVIPTEMPEPKAPKPSPMARFRREKPTEPEGVPTTPVDPLAALAAKQNAGKPRFLGLILTAVLLLALGLFALLSSYLLPESSVARWFKGSTDVEVVDIADEQASDQEDFASLPDEPNLPGTSPDFDNLPIDQDLPSVVEVPTLETPTLDTSSGPLGEANAQTAYVATGIWQRAPDFGHVARPDTLDDLYVASLDPNPTFEDAPALPAQRANSGDAPQGAPKAPPPPGVRYDLDARGLVRPTADGALSPEGVIVFSGRPPIAPVRRDNTTVPNGLAPAIIDETEIEVPVDAAIITPQTPIQTGPFADPALAQFKPRQRPNDLSERVERAQLGGNTRSELARFKPNQRPQTILDQAEAFAEARATEIAAQAQAIEAALAEAEISAAEQERAASLIPLDDDVENDVDTTATALAVARSLKPPARPRGFENIVKSARITSTQPTAEPEVQTASATRASGPAVARGSRVRPSGPTANSVARAATDNNAISLGQVSLVGVFGTSSSRRALVRLPSGRFKKVSIGDRVDGGRVAAIGSSELKYTKSGRTLTLKMPNS